jgi:LPXTG-motif cell wall-anchored protein
MVRKLALAAAVLTLIAAPAAHADGDPASDVLPSQDAYYPYSPAASKPLSAALDQLLAQVRKGGYPLKVAMIGSAADLGSYPTMFNNPQEYTNLLASELPTNPHGAVKDELHLLVIMPGGFGGKNLGDRVDEALGPVEIDVEGQTDGLVRAGLEAVARLATVNGVKTEVPSVASGDDGDGGGSNTLLLVVIGVVIVLLVAALLVVRRRTRPVRPSDERPEGEPEAQGTPEDARIT